MEVQLRTQTVPQVPEASFLHPEDLLQPLHPSWWGGYRVDPHLFLILQPDLQAQVCLGRGGGMQWSDWLLSLMASATHITKHLQSGILCDQLSNQYTSATYLNAGCVALAYPS